MRAGRGAGAGALGITWGTLVCPNDATSPANTGTLGRMLESVGCRAAVQGRTYLEQNIVIVLAVL